MTILLGRIAILIKRITILFSRMVVLIKRIVIFIGRITILIKRITILLNTIVILIKRIVILHTKIAGWVQPLIQSCVFLFAWGNLLVPPKDVNSIANLSPTNKVSFVIF